MIRLVRERIEVRLGARSYPVWVGEDMLAELGSLIPEDSARVVVVTQRGIGVLPELEQPSQVIYIGDGEAAKTLETIGDLCSGFARFGLNRKDFVLAVGGGIVSDVAGFAAASYHRGIRYATIATSLLSQVDAAIGGKTGVNLPEGKNLVGAFWQPSFVACDVALLKTLPEREYQCGLGEMAKYAFLGVAGLPSMALVDQVAACVRVKADFVESDEREGGRRALLNYGHTFAHALEALGFEDARIDFRHGEAVAVGLIFAARLAHKLGRIDLDRVRTHYEVVRNYRLPEAPPSGVDHDRLVDLMASDKKSFGSLTFVLDSEHGVEVVKNVSEAVIRDVLSEWMAEGGWT